MQSSLMSHFDRDQNPKVVMPSKIEV
jgi:hypothetical protein